MSATEKPIRSTVYLGSEARARKVEALAERMGTPSASEAIRRLIDQACEQAGITEAGEQVTFHFDLPAPVPAKW